MIPIYPYLEPDVTPSQRRRAESLAEELRREHPSLTLRDDYRPLVLQGTDSIEEAPSLHLDDQSAIANPDASRDPSYLQDRARARAVAGDYVVTSQEPEPEFAEYCEELLGLGRITWLVARAPGDPRRLANHVMRDRGVRGELIRAFRQESLLYVHPYMGSTAVWELALRIHHKSRRPVRVLAPPPGVAAFVNDKVHFADVVTRLFGRSLLPETYEASNLVRLSEKTRDLVSRHGTLTVKLPDSAAGSGNIVMESDAFAGLGLSEIRDKLKEWLSALAWAGEKHLLVSAWTESVVKAPSTQLWIPPEGTGDPVVEGVFEQRIESGTTRFVGSHRADLPRALLQEVAERSLRLGLLFQRLGYVGRCSFDLVVFGRGVETPRLQFIEANGRWGGTSTPMTLVHRLAGGPWWEKQYVETAVPIPYPEIRTMGAMLRGARHLLFDARRGTGRFVFHNGASLRAKGILHVIAFEGEGEVESPGGVYEELLATSIPRN